MSKVSEITIIMIVIIRKAVKLRASSRGKTEAQVLLIMIGVKGSRLFIKF